MCLGKLFPEYRIISGVIGQALKNFNESIQLSNGETKHERLFMLVKLEIDTKHT